MLTSMGSSHASRSSPAVDVETQTFETFYLRYADRIFRHCLSRLADVHDAEDATAAVFLVALEHSGKVRRLGEADVIPWLMTTANNVMHEQIRRTARARKLLARLPQPVLAPDHAVVLADVEADREALALARRALMTLSEPDREIIELCVIQGLSPSAVASDGTAPGTIRSRLSRALARARTAYDTIAPRPLPDRGGPH